MGYSAISCIMSVPCACSRWQALRIKEWRKKRILDSRRGHSAVDGGERRGREGGARRGSGAGRLKAWRCWELRMRVSVKRFLLSFYISVCGMLTVLNYRYSLLRLQAEMPDPDHRVLRVEDLSPGRNLSASNGAETSPPYFRILSAAIDSANRTVQRILSSVTGAQVLLLPLIPPTTPLYDSRYPTTRPSLRLAAFEKFEYQQDNLQMDGVPWPTFEPDEFQPMREELSPPALYPEDSLHSDRIIEQLNFIPKTLKRGKLKIFLPQGLGAWHVKPDQQEFQMSACPVQNCMLTGSKKEASSAAAVMFRQHITPPLSNEERRPDQIWIYYNLESPEYSGSYANAKNMINWTATYRRDSDLVAPYERFTPLRDIPADQLKDLQFRFPALLFPSSPTRNWAKGKTKKVAWFVSHCSTSNSRERYVRELAKHIQVDTYGACGPLKCARFDKKCDRMLDKDYKFYIAFENSNCKDYVTEKFFINGLGRSVVPIVMGARKEEYAAMSPPDSFIHVDDFPDAAALARYLHDLDNDDLAYSRFFRWKGQGAFINTKFWCRLCAMLNEPRAKTYPDLAEWWKRPGTCVKGKWPS